MISINKNCEDKQNPTKSYGFYPQRKAEGIAFKEELSSSVIIGTCPGFQNGVLVVYDEKNTNV